MSCTHAHGICTHTHTHCRHSCTSQMRILKEPFSVFQKTKFTKIRCRTSQCILHSMRLTLHNLHIVFCFSSVFSRAKYANQPLDTLHMRFTLYIAHEIYIVHCTVWGGQPATASRGLIWPRFSLKRLWDMTAKKSHVDMTHKMSTIFEIKLRGIWPRFS